MSRRTFAVALTVLVGAIAASPAAASVSFDGGPVMHAERVHLVFWDPSDSGGLAFDPGYQQQIETFIERVAAASHSTSNVFSLIGQYRDASGPATYQASYAGAINDTNPLPTDPGSTCTEPLPPPLGTGPGWSACVSDAGIQSELRGLIRARGLPTGLSDIYVVVTPQGFGDCFGSGPEECALGGTASSTTPGYCGYHSDIGNPPILYAVVPYNAVPGHCQPHNPRPNGSTADPAISTVAHEFAETATDPLGDGWSDPGGSEIADLCLTSYGPKLGGSTGATAYDQVIDGGHYYIQELWSNYSRACEPSAKPDSVSISAPRRATAGRPLTLTGSATDPQGRVIGYRWSFGDGRTGARRVAVHAFLKAGSYELTLRITDSWGNWAYATRPITILRPRGAKR